MRQELEIGKIDYSLHFNLKERIIHSVEINGNALQKELLPNLIRRIETLRKSGVVPTIAIVTLGPEATWKSYVGQKIKLAKKLKINYKLINLASKSTEEVLKDIDILNKDSTIDGLIVQRPFPTEIDTERVIQNISKDKDIDGFKENSDFESPVMMAVMYLIKHISHLLNVENYMNWLSNQSILVVGKGETAGEPVIKGLQKLRIQPSIIDSKTLLTDTLYKNADIIIFATGKRLKVPLRILKKTCILIGIGLHRNDGSLRGDFDEFEAKDHVLYYTPSPGGVGPLNLYFLFENLIKASENHLQKGIQ